MLRVSVLELPARWAEPAAALAQVDELLREGPTNLAIVPELAFTGYVSPEGDFDLAPFAEPIDGPTVAAVAAVAKRHHTSLVAPLVLREPGGPYNAAMLVGPEGRVNAVYRKRHPWFPEEWATPGREPPPLVKVGPIDVTFAICFDAQFLHEDGVDLLPRADLLVFTSAWVDEEESRVPLLQSFSRRFGCAVANANWAPGVVRVPGQGGSCILDAKGRVVASVQGPAGRADAIVAVRS